MVIFGKRFVVVFTVSKVGELFYRILSRFFYNTVTLKFDKKDRVTLPQCSKT